MKFISSAQNSQIKELKKLRESSSHRRESGLCLVEGAKELALAASSPAWLKRLYVCEPLVSDRTLLDNLIHRCEEDPVGIPSELFERLVVRENKGGILAVFEARAKPLSSLHHAPKGISLVLSGLEKPGNVGAILRTADGLGIDHVIIARSGTDLYNPNTVRASLGAVFSLDLYQAKDDGEWLDVLKQQDVTTCALALHESSVDLYSVKAERPLALVLGSEDRGLDAETLARVDRKLIIPMSGKVDSFNVSVAAAIALSQLHQRP